jgi:hypothetical protein
MSLKECYTFLTFKTAFLVKSCSGTIAGLGYLEEGSDWTHNALLALELNL